MSSQFPHMDKSPRIDKSCFIASSAEIMGDVEIAEDASVWYQCVLRGDVNDIKIGKRTNIQDGTVIHVATHGQGCYIGDDVTVGHMALLHACTVESGAFIGMKACVMDGAVVEEGAMVAAGAVVSPGKRVPSGQLWAGVPAKYIRDVNDADIKNMKWSIPHYVDLAKAHKAELKL